jgi:type II secretory pathway pseudopilin PulG
MKKFLFSIFPFLFSGRTGQSLVEILIAVIVGMILILGAVAVIGPSLKNSTQASRAQVAIALGKELLENTRAFSEANWHNIGNLSTSSANHYYLNTSSSQFVAVSGDESVTVATTTYTRYFYVEDVYRDGSGKIISGSGTYDPSTKKITVVYKWPGSAPRTMPMYITRLKNSIFSQTDWSGGGGQEGPVTTTNNRFGTSTGIDFTSSTGSIIIKLN